MISTRITVPMACVAAISVAGCTANPPPPQLVPTTTVVVTGSNIMSTLERYWKESLRLETPKGCWVYETTVTKKGDESKRVTVLAIQPRSGEAVHLDGVSPERFDQTVTELGC